MLRNLPTYRISINPELSKDGKKLGISQIAYTSTPAIVIKGIYFNSDVKKMIFTDTLKMRVAAPAMIPDMPIYRQDDELGEYNVVFTSEMIEKMRTDFMMNKGQVVFNLDHTEVTTPSFILDSWITGDPETDPSFTQYGMSVPKGSWFIVSQFTDEEYFKNEIIAKDRVGYSIEGFMGLALSTIKTQLKQNKMEKIKFEKAILEDGTPVFITKMEVGADAYIIDDNGDKAPIFDGEHKLTDGSVVVTVAGKITEIKPKAEELAVAPVAEEVVLAEEVIVETPVVDVPVAGPVLDEAAILAIIQPKLDEIYKAIAEIKTLVEADAAEDVTEEAAVSMKMNSQEALVSFFAKQ